MKSVKEISVFFPAYNEVNNIESTVLSAQKVLKKLARHWEIIVVDDGSTDNTGKLVESLIKKNKNIRLVTHSQNRGYGSAIKTGLKASKYKLICYTDSDGQFDFTEIRKFIKALESGADMAIGFRVRRTDTLYRRFMAKILQLTGLVLFHLKVKDVDCGFKLFKKEVISKIGPLKTASAITETELVTRAKRSGFKIKEIGIKHHSRPGGEQTGGKISVVLKAAVEGIKLWFTLSFRGKLE